MILCTDDLSTTDCDWPVMTRRLLPARAKAAGGLLNGGEVFGHSSVELRDLEGEVSERLLVAVKLYTHHCKTTGYRETKR